MLLRSPKRALEILQNLSRQHKQSAAAHAWTALVEALRPHNRHPRPSVVPATGAGGEGAVGARSSAVPAGHRYGAADDGGAARPIRRLSGMSVLSVISVLSGGAGPTPAVAERYTTPAAPVFTLGQRARGVRNRRGYAKAPAKLPGTAPRGGLSGVRRLVRSLWLPSRERPGASSAGAQAGEAPPTGVREVRYGPGNRARKLMRFAEDELPPGFWAGPSGAGGGSPPFRRRPSVRSPGEQPASVSGMPAAGPLTAADAAEGTDGSGGSGLPHPLKYSHRRERSPDEGGAALGVSSPRTRMPRALVATPLAHRQPGTPRVDESLNPRRNIGISRTWVSPPVTPFGGPPAAVAGAVPGLGPAGAQVSSGAEDSARVDPSTRAQRRKRLSGDPIPGRRISLTEKLGAEDAKPAGSAVRPSSARGLSSLHGTSSGGGSGREASALGSAAGLSAAPVIFGTVVAPLPSRGRGRLTLERSALTVAIPGDTDDEAQGTSGTLSSAERGGDRGGRWVSPALLGQSARAGGSSRRSNGGHLSDTDTPTSRPTAGPALTPPLKARTAPLRELSESLQRVRGSLTPPRSGNGNEESPSGAQGRFSRMGEDSPALPPINEGRRSAFGTPRVAQPGVGLPHPGVAAAKPDAASKQTAAVSSGVSPPRRSLRADDRLVGAAGAQSGRPTATGRSPERGWRGKSVEAPVGWRRRESPSKRKAAAGEGGTGPELAPAERSDASAPVAERRAQGRPAALAYWQSRTGGNANAGGPSSP